MKAKNFLLAALIFLPLYSCSVLNTMVDLSKLQFKLDSVSDFKVMDISTANINSIGDFSPVDIIKLTASVADGHLPVSFSLNVAAKNPNEPKGKITSTDISLKSFPWTLYVDDKETISGNIGNPVTVPGGNQTAMIPLVIKMDLFEFFNNGGFQNVLNLALKLGGSQGSTSKLKLVAEPVLGTAIGDLKYPTPLTIVDTKFK